MENTQPVLKVGDTVYLKSGGPAMTVSCLDYLPSMDAQWFDENHVQHSIFNIACLTTADPN